MSSFSSQQPLYFRKTQPAPVYVPSPHEIIGDGGPVIVLQATAAARWQGAMDFDNSLMEGVAVETDYDVICAAESVLLHRYDRDMLVVDASGSTQGAMYQLSDGTILVSEGVMDAVSDWETIRASAPAEYFTFYIHDEFLRLIAGADAGDGAGFPYVPPRRVDLFVTPGMWKCDVFDVDNGCILHLTPPEMVMLPNL
ncbi:MAG: hypothetical protein H8F28_04435 [Fibrella sp.]|nr:hypothetical protein [Armatimonadota bacterium]